MDVQFLIDIAKMPGDGVDRYTQFCGDGFAGVAIDQHLQQPRLVRRQVVPFPLLQGILTLSFQDDAFKTVKGTYKSIGTGVVAQVTGTVRDHHLNLTVSGSTVYSLRLDFHLNDERLVTGRRIMVGTSYPVFGYRTSGELYYHTRLFYPYFDVSPSSFNGFAFSNYPGALYLAAAEMAEAIESTGRVAFGHFPGGGRFRHFSGWNSGILVTSAGSGRSAAW
jgi:hypothetical protein